MRTDERLSLNSVVLNSVLLVTTLFCFAFAYVVVNHEYNNEEKTKIICQAPRTDGEFVTVFKKQCSSARFYCTEIPLMKNCQAICSHGLWGPESVSMRNLSCEISDFD